MFWRRRWPWVGQQTWEDVVFLHWPVKVSELRPHIPAPLEIDDYDGTAWISVIFFQAKYSRPRSFSRSLSYPPFYQLNVRTYVKFGQEPGVYFFTLHANDPLIVKGARFLQLPYVQSEMQVIEQKDHAIFKAKRDLKVTFEAEYTPGQTPFIAEKGSLSNWLTERYCIWFVGGSWILKAPLFHLPWALYDVDVEVSMQNLLSNKIRVTGKPLAHYAKSMTAYAHPFERFGLVNGFSGTIARLGPQ